MKQNVKNKQYEIDKMKNNILAHKHDIWCPPCNVKFSNVEQNSWFTIKNYASSNPIHFQENSYDVEKKENCKLRAIKIFLDLNTFQKNTINNWLNMYTHMYNIALKYIKNNIKDDKKVLNFQYLRNKLKKQKEILIKNSTIKVHDTDYAIKLACQNYKSALTNFKCGNIQHFRIRYWRNKTNKIMDLEKNNFSKNGMRSKILGKVNGYYNGKIFDFEIVKHDCRLKKENNVYYLYVPTTIEEKLNNNKKNKQITIDPGIRRFCTGITENKVIKIGEKCGTKIEQYLKRKDKILNNKNINNNIKKKNEKTINKKIINLVDELHWKTINYLTTNNETILIGNMSSKSIVSKSGNLNKMTKRISMHLKFYEFHRRLKYKCNTRDVKYGKINEWMTSKMCSICGEIKENLGGDEMYECEKCGIKMERDINGARNIHIKGIK